MNLKRAGILIALVGGVLAISTKLIDVYNLPKFICISLGALVASLGLSAQGGKPLFRPLWVFIYVVVAATIFSVDPLVSITGTTNNYFYGLLPILCAATLFIAASQDGTDVRENLVSLAVLCSVYAIFQATVGEPFNGITDRGVFGGRVFSFAGSPVLLASFLVLAFPFAIERRNWMGVGFIIAAILLTKSRGGIVGILASTATYFWLTGRRRQVALCALAALLVVFVVRREGAGGSDSNRLNAWRCALAQPATGLKAALLGSGPDTFVEVYKRQRTEKMVAQLPPGSGHFEAHNDILNLLATIGLLGLAAYLWLVWMLGRELLKTNDGLFHIWARPHTVGLAALAGGFAYMKFSPMPHYSICTMGVLVAWLLPRGDYKISDAQVAFLRAGCLAALLFSTRVAYAEYLMYKALPGPSGAPISKVLGDMKKGADAAPWIQDYQAFYAQYLFAAKERVEHRRISERNLKYHPDVAMSYYMMANTGMLDGEPDKARKYLEEARKRDPLHPLIAKLEKEINDDEQRRHP